jgi:tRNA splicing endonuclease
MAFKLIELPFDPKLVELGFGIEEGGKLLLHPLELKYAVERGYTKDAGNADVPEDYYLVYKDLRDKGYNMRLSQDSDLLRIYRKGFRRGEDRTMQLLRVVSAGSVDVDALLADSSTAIKMRKELVYAFVEGKNIMYMAMSKTKFP